MDFNYFYGRGADQFAFYQIPKILITDEKFAGITMESKILYSVMLDRASLSAKNGWLDEDGKVFIYYKLDRIMADMHCANQKAISIMALPLSRLSTIPRVFMRKSLLLIQERTADI